jgi:hypothetical protein
MPYKELKCFLPHSDFGDPECCGFLLPVRSGDQAELVCNECGVTMHRMTAADLKRKIAEMEFQFVGTPARAVCPHCGKVNEQPGFPELFAFVCSHCGEGIGVPHDSASLA